MDYDLRFLLNPKSEEYDETYERIYGWKCFYCKKMNRGEKCKKCSKTSEEARA